MPKRTPNRGIDVLDFEYERRVLHVRSECPNVATDIYKFRLRQIEMSMKKPLTVQDLRIMLGDHPEWYEVKLVKGRIKVAAPGSFD